MDFNIVDIIVGIFLAYGIYLGFQKGLIYQLSSLLGLILGIYGAIHFSDSVSQYLASHEGLIDAKYVKAVALFITFIGILIAIHFLGKVLESLFSLTGLDSLNTIGGVAFSLLKQLIIVSLLIMFILFVNSKVEMINPAYFNESVLFNTIINPIIGFIRGII